MGSPALWAATSCPSPHPSSAIARLARQAAATSTCATRSLAAPAASPAAGRNCSRHPANLQQQQSKVGRKQQLWAAGHGGAAAPRPLRAQGAMALGRRWADAGAMAWAGGSAPARRLRSPPPLLHCSPAPSLRPPQGSPFYRIFAADARCPRDGRHLEQLGHFDPVPSASFIERGRRLGAAAAVALDACCAAVVHWQRC